MQRFYGPDDLAGAYQQNQTDCTFSALLELPQGKGHLSLLCRLFYASNPTYNHVTEHNIVETVAIITSNVYMLFPSI